MSQPENEAQKERKEVPEKPVATINVELPKGELKDVGGGDRDQWNERISTIVIKALPVDLRLCRYGWRGGHEACRSD